MKKAIQILSFFLAGGLYAQKIDYNTKKGFVAHGYDVVAYFSNTAIPGKAKYIATHKGAKFKFSNKKNLELFNNNPDKYTPQYGGYCAYAIASKAKVKINPETFLIKNDKLYLFYKKWGVNTLKKWKKEQPEKLEQLANKNWETMKYKK